MWAKNKKIFRIRYYNSEKYNLVCLRERNNDRKLHSVNLNKLKVISLVNACIQDYSF